VVVSEEETEVAFVAVSIVAVEALEAVTVASAGHQTRRADRVADSIVTVETSETAGAAAAGTVDATTTEDTAEAAEAASAAAIGPAPGATPCRLVKGTAETETEVETAETAETEEIEEIETETGIVAATTTVTTRGNGPTKAGQATKVNANCAATDDKTANRLVVGILSPLISLLSSSTFLASLTTRVSRRKRVFPHPGQPHTPCLKVKNQRIIPEPPTLATLRRLRLDRLRIHQGVSCTRRISWSRHSVICATQRLGGCHTSRVRTGSIAPCKMTTYFLYLPVTRRGKTGIAFEVRSEVRTADPTDHELLASLALVMQFWEEKGNCNQRIAWKRVACVSSETVLYVESADTA
jgi:hypothetical protein